MWTFLKPVALVLIQLGGVALNALAAWVAAQLQDNPEATMMHWAQVPLYSGLGITALVAGEWGRRSSTAPTDDVPPVDGPAADDGGNPGERAVTTHLLDSMRYIHHHFADSPEDLARVQELSLSLMRRTFPAEQEGKKK